MHEQGTVSLDPAGGVTLRFRNVSVLWDRSVASTAAIAGDSAPISFPVLVV